MKPTVWDNVRQSIYNLIDHTILENGAYVNVTKGQTTHFGKDTSLLYPVTDDTLPYPTSGHIWQSAFHNFVYESGIQNLPPPILVSGIYINNVFTPKTSGMHIDYYNGRIILDTPISTSSTVQAEFAYKEYSFVAPDNNKPFKSSTKFRDNSKVYEDPFVASPDEIYLPALFIETEKGEDVPFEMGGVNFTEPTLKITVISDNQAQLESFASLICQFKMKSLPIIPATDGPKFDFFGDLRENYSFYQWVTLNQNFGFLKSVNYNRFYNANNDNKEPLLFAGAITIEISSVRFNQ